MTRRKKRKKRASPSCLVRPGGRTGALRTYLRTGKKQGEFCYFLRLVLLLFPFLLLLVYCCCSYCCCSCCSYCCSYCCCCCSYCCSFCSHSCCYCYTAAHAPAVAAVVPIRASNVYYWQLLLLLLLFFWYYCSYSCCCFTILWIDNKQLGEC